MKSFVYVLPYITHNAFGRAGTPVVKVLLGRRAGGEGAGLWDGFGGSSGRDAAEALSRRTVGLLGSTDVLASKLRKDGLWMGVPGGTYILLQLKPRPALNLEEAFSAEMKFMTESERIVDKIKWAEVDDGIAHLPLGKMSPQLETHMPVLGKYMARLVEKTGRVPWSEAILSELRFWKLAL